MQGNQGTWLIEDICNCKVVTFSAQSIIVGYGEGIPPPSAQVPIAEPHLQPLPRKCRCLPTTLQASDLAWRINSLISVQKPGPSLYNFLFFYQEVIQALRQRNKTKLFCITVSQPILSISSILLRSTSYLWATIATVSSKDSAHHLVES